MPPCFASIKYRLLQSRHILFLGNIRHLCILQDDLVDELDEIELERDGLQDRVQKLLRVLPTHYIDSASEGEDNAPESPRSPPNNHLNNKHVLPKLDIAALTRIHPTFN